MQAAQRAKHVQKVPFLTQEQQSVLTAVKDNTTIKKVRVVVPIVPREHTSQRSKHRMVLESVTPVQKERTWMMLVVPPAKIV